MSAEFTQAVQGGGTNLSRLDAEVSASPRELLPRTTSLLAELARLDPFLHESVEAVRIDALIPGRAGGDRKQAVVAECSKVLWRELRNAGGLR